MNTKPRVILAGVSLLTAMVIVSCAPPTMPAPVKETVIVRETVVVPATVAVKPTEAPKPPAPAAVLKIKSVPANVALPGAITNTLKYITDTNVPAGGTAVIATGATGLNNVPLNVPVRLSASSLDAKIPVTKTAWTLITPPGSQAKIKDPAATVAEFTPDAVGVYKVNVVLSNAAGNGALASVQINAGTYVGATAGNCKQCHPTRVAEWEKTNHATIFTREIDKPSQGEYSEACIYCHTTGYFMNAANGGFRDVQTKLGWKFPARTQIAKGGNWTAIPAELQNMVNVQCEACHGPAKEHATVGAKVMASGLSQGVCDVCHNASAKYSLGTDLQNDKHSEEKFSAWNTPIGPGAQECVRCHSGAGYVSFLENPKNRAAWENRKEVLGCASCHDPHDAKHPWQLRIAGKPRTDIQDTLPFVMRDVGLSTTCFVCHNARVKPEDALRNVFPHYSSVAEFMSITGGVTYGQIVPNSPHGLVVGDTPMQNPDAAKDPMAPKFMFSYMDKTKNIPGPCVVCHMWQTITDVKDPYYHKVGAHSFNTLSPDGKFDYTAPCVQCHTSIKDTKDFNLKAKADFDGNGKIEGVQTEVRGLLSVLWKALTDKGVKKLDGDPFATLPPNADDKVKNAWYNYRTVYGVMWGISPDGKPTPGNEGKAQAIHNFKRAVALLQLSIKDLTGSLPKGMADGTK